MIEFEPFFLNVEDVEAIHAEGLRTFGGQDGIRDRGLLESAVAMPQSSFGGAFLHDSLVKMAAAYAFHIAQNQPFLDGNKRAAIGAALTFLDLNGIVIPAGDEIDAKLYEAMISIAVDETKGKEHLAEVIESLLPSFLPD